MSMRARRPTIRDVAKQAGVSVGTVSRVTNDHASVAPAIRDRVLVAVRDLGYRPDDVARAMRTEATRMVGCIVGDIRNPLYAAAVKAAEEALSVAGYTLVIANTDSRPERELAVIDSLMRRRVDGLMAVVAEEGNPEVLAALRATEVPVVLLEREAAIPADMVATDHAGGTRRATELLLSLGHRRIALITGTEANRSGRERTAGYRAAFAAAGIAVDPMLVRAERLTTEYAFEETQRLLGLQPRPTAFIAGGNQMLAGVLRAIALAGLAIPHDLSVVTSGDTLLAAVFNPPITAIHWDLEAFGRIAADLLLQHFRKPGSPPARVIVPCELLLRQSCAAAAP